jgi:hypothetical protein
MRTQGLPRVVLLGALRRGVPMAIVVTLLLELIEGGTLDRARLLAPAFLERAALVLVVFLLGGALSSFARWKSFEALFGDDSTGSGGVR